MDVIHGSLIPSTTNTPLDARCRVATEADISKIENPYVGLLIYCIENSKFYVVTSLTSKQIGPIESADSMIGSYIELVTDATLSEEDKNALFDEFEDRILSAAWGFDEEEKAALLNNTYGQLLTSEYGEVAE